MYVYIYIYNLDLFQISAGLLHFPYLNIAQLYSTVIIIKHVFDHCYKIIVYCSKNSEEKILMVSKKK